MILTKDLWLLKFGLLKDFLGPVKFDFRTLLESV